jgi:hypothetical protein
MQNHATPQNLGTKIRTKISAKPAQKTGTKTPRNSVAKPRCKIGALAQGLPACNGWTFWHFFREGRYEPIGALRSLVRASLRQAAE